MNNPQYLLKLPVVSSPGSRFADGNRKHKLEVKVERIDGGTETMNLTIYKSVTSKQMMETPESSLTVAESSNTEDRKTATATATVVGGSYIICISLDADNVKGSFKLTVSTDEHEPRVSALTKQVAEIDSCWNPATGRCGGYGKAANPQFVLTLPAGEHDVLLTMRRGDGKSDVGLIYWIFAQTGDAQSLDTSLKTGDSLAASKFIKGASVETKHSLEGGRSYLVLCTAQSTELEAPFRLTATIEGRAVPILTEITGGGVPSAATTAAAAAAAPTAAKGTPAALASPDITLKGKWGGAMSGGYQKVDNPQYLLSLEGSGDTSVKLERLDGLKDQGMILFAYTLTNEQAKGYRLPKLPAVSAVIAQSKFIREDDVTAKIPNSAATAHFLLLPCLQNAGTNCDFNLLVSSAGKATLKEVTELEPSTAVVCAGSWTAKLSGGYQKADNPQFKLEMPTKGMVKLSLTRSDKAKDCGMICTVYKVDGYGGGRVESFQADDVAAKTGFKVSAGPLAVEQILDAGTYIVVPSLQKKGTTGPFEISADGKVSPTMEEIAVGSRRINRV